MRSRQWISAALGFEPRHQPRFVPQFDLVAGHERSGALNGQLVVGGLDNSRRADHTTAQRYDVDAVSAHGAPPSTPEPTGNRHRRMSLGFALVEAVLVVGQFNQEVRLEGPTTSIYNLTLRPRGGALRPVGKVPVSDGPQRHPGKELALRVLIMAIAIAG